MTRKPGRVAPLSQRAHFERWAYSPQTWAETARGLKLAADLLGDQILEENDRVIAGGMRLRDSIYLVECVPAFGLLAGSAIEGLTKALVIKSKTISRDPERLSGDLHGHRVSHYLRLAGFPLSKEDADLVKWLEETVIWAGQYPVPKRAEQLGTSR